MAKYTVSESESRYRENPAAMRKEYSRLRDIAEKRIKRLKGTEFEETKTFKSHQNGFEKLKNIDPRDIPKAFSELSKFIEATGSSATGQKKIQKQTMERLNRAIGETDENENPVDVVTKKNYWRVVKILDEARRQKVTFGSDKIVELADATLSLSKDQFDVLLDNLSHFYGHTEDVEGMLTAYAEGRSLDEVDIDEFVEWTGW